MSRGTEQGQTPTGTQREFREYALDNLEVDHSDVHPIAGLGIPPEIRRVLMFMADNYSPPRYEDGRVVEGYPRDFWETDLAQRAVRKHATDTATTAVREDNVSQLATMVGQPSHDSDISGLHEIADLEDWLVQNEDCMLIYIASLMGRGKTDFASLIFELIDHHYQRLRDSIDDYSTVPEFAANFALDPASGSDAEVDLVNDYPTLRSEWFQDEGSSADDVRWFIFDEASSELTAQNAANAQKVVERMGSLVKKMRKHGVNLIVIGHDRQDVHPAIRSMCKYIDKTSKKQAKIYEGIQQREPYNLQLEIGGIPETSWSYDTNDSAVWSWGDGIEDDDVGMDPEEVSEYVKDQMILQATRAYLDHDSLTQSDAADLFSSDDISISPSTISRRQSEVKELRDKRERAKAQQNNQRAPADD